MNAKFLNPFVEAATEVLRAEVDVTLTRGALLLQKSALTAGEVTVLLSLVGQLQGVVLYGMSIQTSLRLVGAMMGQEFREFDNLAQSGIAELGNVITGQATIKLAQAGYATEISPPTLITGHGVQISTLDFQRLVVPLQFNGGLIEVHLALREAALDAHANGVPLPAGAGHNRN